MPTPSPKSEELTPEQEAEGIVARLMADGKWLTERNYDQIVVPARKRIARALRAEAALRNLLEYHGQACSCKFTYNSCPVCVAAKEARAALTPPS